MMRCAMPSKSMATRGCEAPTLAALVRGDTAVALFFCAESGTAGVGIAAAAAAFSSSLSGSSGLGSPFFSTAMYSADVTGWSYDVMSSQPLAGPKFVLARNQRYLPLASHAGDVA